MNRKRGYLYILLAAMIYSTTEVALKGLGGVFAPMQITVERVLIGALFLLPFALRSLRRNAIRLTRSDWSYFALLGFLTVTLHMSLLQMAVLHMDASATSIIYSGNPVFALAAAHLILHEPLKRNHLIGIFPSNLWESFRTSNMLQVIVIAILLGGGILTAGEKGKLAQDMVTSLYAVIERVMAFIISLSPIGVFTMMAWVVATQGPEILGSLGIVLGCAYIGYIVHAVLCYSVSAKAFAGISPITFFKKASPAMIFAFTSTSSAATIPLSMECSEDLGAENDISSFVIPLGATINMDGTAIYQCVATIFLATCCGMTLTLGQMVTIVVTATLASIGTAGTPGAGMIMLAMVLQAMNIPVDMIMIIYGVDRLFDMGRTCLNITGDISCALCVTKWESKKTAVK